ncbi:uncharacterized protein PAC_12052 [Phialocephala subalpina]|uniref:Protein HRI1 n=1 Tax=Phialocephala subalpina TaxID=576137 RepID=A0A1L7XAW7_9HELO|nr:uncharacterized protein PAC_12052 [Phialocephala subalpina]
MPPQVLQRVSVRWLPEPAFEDTDTIALNVGGYFLDLRIVKADGSVQWSRAGQRKVVKQEPFTYQWTRIIDSTGILDPDEAAWDWQKLGNGDAFESGIAKCPLKNGALTSYEEIWRDVTRAGPTPNSWILQSADGRTFLSCIGATFLGMRSDPDGGFDVKRSEWDSKQKAWSIKFEGGHVAGIPGANAVFSIATGGWTVGATVALGSVEYVVKAFETTPDLVAIE